jgi:serine/threonine protein kinase
MIVLPCPECQTKLRVKDDLAGRRVACPSCRKPVAVPSPRDDATLPPPAPDAAATLPPKGERETLSFHAPVGANGPVSPGLPGERFAERGRIGRGGMGEVVRVVDNEIRREVAVKYLLNQADERQRARFLEEARITGQLEHPNIVPVHDVGIDGQGRLYFSMKMVKGRSLAEVFDALRKDDPAAVKEYTLGRLLTILLNVGNALAYAHSRGVIHRDLKPANIMVGDFGEAYVMDWGLAKILGTAEDAPAKVEAGRPGDAGMTQDGSVVGTPSYMPPEQAMGKIAELDQRSDIYSLGAILYETLTLSPPTGPERDTMAILVKVAEGDIDPPERQSPRRARLGLIPPELSAVAMKALAKEPKDRYQTVEDLQKDVQLYMEGRSVSAKRDSAWELFTKLVKRNKGASIATAAALLVLAGVVTAAMWVNINERVKAQKARDDAEGNYKAYLAEVADKNERSKRSAPAFLRAARLMTNEKQFEDALTQADAALEFDPSLTKGLLLRGQILLALGRHAEAAAALAEYVKAVPDDADARELVALAAKPEPKKTEFLWAVWEVFKRQKEVALGDHVSLQIATITGPKEKLLEVYRKKIEATPGWAGRGQRLTLDKFGRFNMNLVNQGKLDLEPLRGIRLHHLNASGTKVEDLSALEGMPLTELHLWNCEGIKDLSPLGKMRLTHLVLHNNPKITSLEPLKGMPLVYLGMDFCTGVTDLSPLKGMGTLETLQFRSYGSTAVTTLEPLTGLKKLKKLIIAGAPRVTDLSPLKGMRLEHLDISGTGVRDLSVLPGMPLHTLSLTNLPVSDLKLLSDMPLTTLSLEHCRGVEDLSPLKGKSLKSLNLRHTRIRDLSPLKGMPLKTLNLEGCSGVEDFGVLSGMPLEGLDLGGCTGVTNLGFLKGNKALRALTIHGCGKLRDLSPLADLQLAAIWLTPSLIGKEGLKPLRDIGVLVTIHVEGKGPFTPKAFWEKLEKGEFDR